MLFSLFFSCFLLCLFTLPLLLYFTLRHFNLSFHTLSVQSLLNASFQINVYNGCNFALVLMETVCLPSVESKCQNVATVQLDVLRRLMPSAGIEVHLMERLFSQKIF